MRDAVANPFGAQELGEELLGSWQSLIDFVARILDVPAALVMRVAHRNIEVFLSSATEGNPYNPGDTEQYIGSGLYCEWVVQNEERLYLPDSRKVPAWDRNPDIKLGMVSYLGFPIKRPDGLVFGTICVLDNKERAYSEDQIRLLGEFGHVLEQQLRIFAQDRELDLFRQVLPICSECKSYRDADGTWHPVEYALERFSGKPTSHGVCPTCYPRFERRLRGDSSQG